MSARTMPERCVACALTLRTATAPREAGERVYSGRGLCNACSHRVARHALQPTGRSRAARVSRDVLVDEVPMLRSCGLAESEIAERLGMRPLSFRRACERAGLNRRAA